ncbi:hypothetical protein IC235_03145 [Hymenobacter sp. BT664]|uniref:Uncharacterized protein n=1 Tax=Hymenobacter montanus TaxID=2771359 RepID=A0A927GIB1_9BACT|nr:hypothetical protein [Hymenobacter montanus]MBD2766886.1 hypothetical protein [Hymenobacter montanus]
MTYEARYQLAEQHWWFANRRDAVHDLITSLQLPKTSAILEISCLGGPLIQWYQTAFHTGLASINVSSSNVELTKARGVAPNIAVMNRTNLAFVEPVLT